MHSTARIAIIGAGRWGRNLLKTFASRTPIALVCHAGSTRTDEWLAQEYPSLPITHNVHDVMQRSDVRTVCIATPIQTHATLVRLALENGKDVFVEKPLCTDPEEAAALTLLAQKNARILMVGYLYLYHELWQRLKQELDGEQVQSMLFSWQKYGSFHEDGVWNLAVHEIALAHDLLGEPEKAEYEPIASVLGTNDVYRFALRYPRGVAAHGIVNRLSSTTQHTVTVHTAQRSYLWDGTRLFRSEKEQEPTLIAEAQSLPLDRECDAFLEALDSREEPHTNGTQATLVTKTTARALATIAQ